MSSAEDRITDWFARQSKLAASRFPIGIGDDMAQVRLAADNSILITTDMLLDGVHFDLKQTTLEQVGYKAMAVSLSDCAAMATIPVAAVVSVALPKGYTGKELKQLHKGITRIAKKFNCPLIGGDITSWNTDSPFAISVAMLSRQSENKPVTRTGAKPGDSICVTGSIGAATAGKHLKFEPRVKEALEITRIVRLNAMMDISDGLSTDLSRICRLSKVGAIIDAQSIPISAEAAEKTNPLDAALNEGEDFELLFTLSDRNCRKLLNQWKAALPITKIGVITDTEKLRIKKTNGKIIILKPRGYDHLH